MSMSLADVMAVDLEVRMEEKHVFVSEDHQVEQRISKAKKQKRTAKGAKGCFLAAVILFLLSFAALCAAFLYLDKNDLIPENLIRWILIGVGGFVLFEIVLLVSARKRIFLSVLSLLLCLSVISASTYGIYALSKIYESMEDIEDPKTYFAHVGVYVKKDSVYAPTMSEPEEEDEEPVQIPGESLNGCVIGTMLLNLDQGYSSRAVNQFRKTNDVTINTYEDFGSMIDAFRNGSVDALIYNEVTMGLFLGEENDFFDWAVEAESIGIETENKVIVKAADVVSEPFIVYICGLDTDNEDYFSDDWLRCDANIVVCVDPVNKKILLINTPRDYYVPLKGRTYFMDKLTHAGIYGVDWCVETLENLYDIDINYYVRTNIYSVVKIVDALGGITVHSDYDFYSEDQIGEGRQFHVGENEVDGHGALCFLRERESFAEGDKQRGVHQMEVIKAVIHKACSPAIIAHFTDVLNVVTSSVRTNVTKDEINALIKMELSDMASWSVESYSVDGYGDYDFCSAMGSDLYVVKPYYDTVYEAQARIKEFMS